VIAAPRGESGHCRRIGPGGGTRRLHHKHIGEGSCYSGRNLSGIATRRYQVDVFLMGPK